MTKSLDELGALIAREHEERVESHAFDFLPDIDTAYRVQKAFVKATLGGSDRVAGYKIGLTSQRMQILCGIDEPVSGAIFASRIHRTGAWLNRSDYSHLGLEFEICARLGADLPPRPEPYTRDEAGAAVDGVCAAIELVDDRFADYKILDPKSLIADNSWNAGIVLGAFVAPPAAIGELEAVAFLDGVECGRGKSSDTLGHPFEPLCWLANNLSRQNEGLKKGDLVMTGSIVTTRFPETAFSYRFEVGDLGSVEVRGA